MGLPCPIDVTKGVDQQGQRHSALECVVLAGGEPVEPQSSLTSAAQRSPALGCASLLSSFAQRSGDPGSGSDR